MKKLLVLAALGTILAAPTFAQNDPRGRTQRPSTVPPGGIYYYKHNGNPHHLSGGSRSKLTLPLSLRLCRSE
jgi:hypothetical protein